MIIRSGWQTDAGVMIHWLDSCQQIQCEKVKTEVCQQHIIVDSLILEIKCLQWLWGYGISSKYGAGSVTVSNSHYAVQRTALEIITGEIPDITQYLEFGIYNWVVFKSNTWVCPPELGWWMGVSHKIGDLMSYWIIPLLYIPVSCTTVKWLINLEHKPDRWRNMMKDFDGKFDE